MKLIFHIATAFVPSVLMAASPAANAARPFTLPVAAKAAEQSRDGKGWQEGGMMSVPFVQAEASFKSAMAQRGWKYLHAVALGKGNTHTLYTWRRGGNELTLMLRRVDVNKTSFSWGLAKNRKIKKE